MSFEYLVGLQVDDDDTYQRYRAAMRPILERCGGLFRYDFRVAETLHAETPEPINRVFVLAFPDRPALEGFFADPDYQVQKERYFTPSVSATTILAEFER